MSVKAGRDWGTGSYCLPLRSGYFIVFELMDQCNWKTGRLLLVSCLILLDLQLESPVLSVLFQEIPKFLQSCSSVVCYKGGSLGEE